MSEVEHMQQTHFKSEHDCLDMITAAGLAAQHTHD